MTSRLKDFKMLNPAPSMVNGSESGVVVVMEMNGSTQTGPIEGERLIPENYMKKITAIRLVISQIKSNSSEIKKLNSNYNSATRIQAEQEIVKQIDERVAQSRKLSNELKNQLIDIKQDLQTTAADQSLQGDAHIKQNLYNSVSVATQQAILESQKVQEQYRQDIKNKSIRQIKRISPEMTAEEIQAISEDPEQAGQVLQQKIFNQSSFQLQNAVKDAQEKYKEILKLEKSISELHQLMLDIQTMVSAQGELIENIAINVSHAKQNVVKAEVNLVSAKKHHIAAKRKAMCVIVIGLIAIGLLVLIVIR